MNNALLLRRNVTDDVIRRVGACTGFSEETLYSPDLLCAVLDVRIAASVPKQNTFLMFLTDMVFGCMCRLERCGTSECGSP